MTSGISSTKEQAGHGAPFASFSVVFNNYFLPDRLDDKMNTSIKEQETFSIKKGDILITRTSETIDELAMSCIALKDYPCATYSGFVKRLRPLVKGVADDKYMAFYLRSKLFRKTMTNNASMTLRASFNEDIFSFLDLFLPDFNDQIKIGNLLYAIEKKIQLNNKINETLQKQASLLYDYWFVQFDFPNEKGKPYKSSGGKMVYNEVLKREIPEGWEVKSLGKITRKNTTSFDYNSTQPTIDLSVMPSGSISLNQINSSDEFSTNLFLMNEGDILFGSIRPYLKKAGIAPCNGAIAGTVHSYRVDNINNYNFVLFTLSRDSFFEYAVRLSTGTKMPVVSSDNVLAYKVPYSHSVAKLFSKINIKTIICKNNQETQELIALRDWLLPMLMNGQATVAEEQKPIFQVIENGTKNEQPDRFALWLQNQGLAARGDIDRQTLREIFDAMDDDDK